VRHALRAALTVVLLAAGVATLTTGSAAAQTAPEPPPAPVAATDVDCLPLSLLCGLQVGPNNFDVDILPGGSVFPPQPPGGNAA
jgi:hypothetical protein